MPGLQDQIARHAEGAIPTDIALRCQQAGFANALQRKIAYINQIGPDNQTAAAVGGGQRKGCRIPVHIGPGENRFGLLTSQDRRQESLTERDVGSRQPDLTVGINSASCAHL